MLGVRCLNPCFSGLYSLTTIHLLETMGGEKVLILVLVDFTL